MADENGMGKAGDTDSFDGLMRAVLDRCTTSRERALAYLLLGLRYAQTLGHTRWRELMPSLMREARGLGIVDEKEAVRVMKEFSRSEEG